MVSVTLRRGRGNIEQVGGSPLQIHNFEGRAGTAKHLIDVA
jgi:hypothetical protein